MMQIDLHIHSNASDGILTIQEIIKEAKTRNIGFMSITNHDSIKDQNIAVKAAKEAEIRYITGVELNVTFSQSNLQKGKKFNLDFLGYQFDLRNITLKNRLESLAKYRKDRVVKIFNNLRVLLKEKGHILSDEELHKIQLSAEGTIGRPHIADYLVKRGIVNNRQEAFEKYLVEGNSPKYPLFIEEASKLIRDAGGKLILAHPNDPQGTSLSTLTRNLQEQTDIIKEEMLPYIDGVECWHSRNTSKTTSHYIEFAKNNGLIMTGGSDCHQKPIIMGTVKIPEWVMDQF
ncbi:MAG: PHP domain-containing protein [Candidatus Bathyarchaeota archaeon]|nr:PHP domain-containing protein [Candidatus Bathyarchaeota archaeon]MDD4324899.1 PHP domain-containing protein [Candidatus Bathyarchaeota archaeon]MDI9578502.1 PHP domain-containing protein [Thermoproteota archaeon]MDT8781780.1 PHP domain-containing protein [Candidatus Bathyarchaeota archaeon]NLD65314.1 PHP domain-containing protein [Thermoproteota archaeon]